MILESLAVVNFCMGVYDSLLTKQRIQEYGPVIETTTPIRWLATRMGPETAALLGILLPVAGWTFGLLYFKLGIPLALLTGFNLKGFWMRLASRSLEKDPRVQKFLKELGGSEDMDSGGNSDMKRETDEIPQETRLPIQVRRKERQQK
jgi:hypothetical protein